VAAIALLLVLAGCNKDEGPEKPKIPSEFIFSGELRLSGSQYVAGNLSSCLGVGPFVDIHKGARVIVTDQDARPIAAGSIIDGLGTNYYEELLDECVFRLRVPEVPRAKSYFLVVGRQGPKPVSLASVAATNGVIRIDVNPPTVRKGVSPPQI
jgi:hypothetical protein